MYHAKTGDGNHIEFYGESMNVDAKRRLRRVSQLHRALEQQEFVLHYQPVRNAVTGALVAAEALLRWNAPEEGLVPPNDFIPFAEETGLIVPIGEWVLRTACAQARAWQDAGFRSIRMAVNVSTHQLRQPGWFQTVVQALEETGLAPAQLELELTESAILHHDDVTAENLRALDEMGIGLSLDDFGTGYSSLAYLQRFPVRRVKIDRSFVQEIAPGQDAPLAEAILAMAKSLKLNVVAEGVETEYQAEYLCAHGCDELQGYLLSRPIPAQDFLRFLEKGKSE
jgi:EAL domain-containing protein (putative c-di-GMP-specific phosphodiesterase class I)